ncbi:MAG: hypothetical protein FWF11_00345 [Coriobacteriia bacterium]|nr:hypothetical protein [Coriobacteriia bacterium]
MKTKTSKSLRRLALRSVSLRACALLLTLLFAAGVAGVTGGASEIASAENPGEDSVASAPLEVLLYKVFRVPDGYAALIGGEVSADVALPVRFEVAIPAGAEVFWFGEVHGGPRDQDPTFAEPFEVRREGDFDIYSAVTYDHVIHIEYLLGYDATEILPDGNHRVWLEYTPLHDAKVLRLATYLPKDSIVFDENLEFIGITDETHEPQFARTFVDVRGGQSYSVEILYEPPDNFGQQTTSLEGGIIAAAVAVLVAVAVVAGFALFARSKRKHTAENEEVADKNTDNCEEDQS